MRNEWTIDPDRGLWLFRASRLEALLDPLEALLAHLPPHDWLAPQTVLIGHPGLRPWLRQSLAAKRGPRGIVANLEFALPSPWLDRLAVSMLGLPDAAARGWQREVLRWRLLPALNALDDGRVRDMLAEDDGTQAFALAERLSAALAPLMLYRADWLRRWSRGESVLRGDALLAQAWRALHADQRHDDARTPHRGERLTQLARRLHEAELRPEGLAHDPLHLFGLHHLAPPELAVLRALSRWRPVVLHVADPCREHWLGMGSGRAAMREALAREDVGESAFLALDHPLLAGWGRLGQHFLLALEDGDLAVNERHGVDALDAAPTTLLERVQHSLRRNAPALMRVESPAAFAALRDDASLRVQRCATPLRELEVLREALAEAFVALPGLQPADIVVLSPDLARYRALIPAVFGEPDQRHGTWPWHAADAPLAATHSVYRAFALVLTLPDTRLSAPSLLDLLSHSVVARRFGLEGENESTLRHVLARLGVAWGFDADDRADFDAPADGAHTFAWSLDRAMAGHVLGVRDAEVLELPDGERVLPGEGIDANVAERLGRLFAMLLELREWVELSRSTHPPITWSSKLALRIDTLFEIAPDDDEARDALDTVRGLLAELAEEWRDASLDAPLPWALVRDALQAKLAAVPERQRFLVGGITFAGMVPQRAIPFRVVAVLGLNEGALPRHGPDDGFELRARSPRFGDRDLASDDRYLFLETLMAVRERLHLSFVGVGADDGRPRNPAGPLADLIDTLARFVPPIDQAKSEAGWPWERQAPLQPPRPGGRGDDGGDESATRDAPSLAITRLHGAATDDAPFAAGAPAMLEALLAFFRDPAKQALRDGLGVRLDGLEDGRLDDSEPLAPQADPREAIARGLVFAALERGDEPPDAIDEAWRLGGRLPPGLLGEALWREQREQAMRTLASLRASQGAPIEPLSAPMTIAVDLLLNRDAKLHAPAAAAADPRLIGSIAVREDATGTLWLIAAHPGRKAVALHFGQRVPLLLAWLALRLSQEKPVRVALVGEGAPDALGERLAAEDAAFLVSTDPETRATRRADYAQQLRFALEFRSAVLSGEACYLPATGWAAWRHAIDDPERVAKAWLGGERATGERDYAPGYAALWGPHWQFAPDDEHFQALHSSVTALTDALPLLLGPMEEGDE